MKAASVVTIFLAAIIAFIGLSVFSNCCSPDANRLRHRHVDDDDDDVVEENRVHLILTTDNHGFFTDLERASSSNTSEPADYADLITLVDRTRAAFPGMTFAMENGDVVDGGGLSDKVTRKYERGELFFPILNEIGFDARTLGNHELYSPAALDSLKKYASLDANYVSSNVEWHNETLGRKYRSFPLAAGETGGSLLTLGFLYEMTDAAPGARVEKVRDVVEREWFARAISNPNVRAVVVLAHMGYDNALLGVILAAIRERYGRERLPVVFVTGHTHVRAHKILDPFAISLECGKYFDTVGLLSFRVARGDGSATQHDDDDDPDFRHTFLDTTKRALYGVFPDAPRADTPRAARVRSLFRSAYNRLDLARVVGRSPLRYRVSLRPESPDSLWGLYLDRVVPEIVFRTVALERRRRPSSSMLFVTGSGCLRYDLLPGPITVDDVYHLAPFTERYAYFEDVLGAHALDLFDSSSPLQARLRAAPSTVEAATLSSDVPLPRSFHVPRDVTRIEPAERYTLICDGFDAGEVEAALIKVRARDEDASLTRRMFTRSLSLHDAWVEFFLVGGMKRGGGSQSQLDGGDVMIM